MNNDYLEGMTTIQQRNVTSIYEPQNPLYHKEKDAYFYPLTSEKQIVMDDGRRLNAVLEEDFAKKDEVNSAKTEAVNDSKVYTNEQVKKAAPRNLLDNSDFRNPVNQRGQTSYTLNGYTIDRWQIWNGSVTVSDGYITANEMFQLLDLPLDKVYTLAACTDDGSIAMVTAIPLIAGGAVNGGLTVSLTNLNGYAEVVVSGGKNIVWAALYEGEYTIDTLPEYQPKGYETELMICRQYDPTTGEYIGLRKFGQPRNLLDNSDFRNPVNQRGQTSYSGGYCIDRWMTAGGGMTIDNGIKISANTVFIQVFEKNIADGVKRTLAIGTNDGAVYCQTISATYLALGNSGCEVTFDAGQAVYIRCSREDVLPIAWAALYEGEYTTETLPEYQPKGYGAELAECQRYYQIRSTNNISAVDMRPLMRLENPTITEISNGYAYSADL